ncbi:hypothetical protein [Cohnella sp. WQ 127256]|uniref:hypothetical protein n=1 Tax=Cohnella sp. WQ 127256 TaxID=2938790 RepID=UPI0021182066|nr:hypothetical protein [Cohnella sp. WQ 127256]
MEKLKAHAAIPMLVVALAILTVMVIFTYKSKDNGAFEIKDLIGSKEAIQDVTISGELRDGAHRTLFRLEEGQLHANTEIFNQPQWTDAYLNVFGGKKTGDGMVYNVENYPSTYNITSRKIIKGFWMPMGNAEVNPSIAYKNPEGVNNSVTLANLPEYGLAKVGDKVYYTVPVSPYFTGSSGIYELKFYEWGFRSVVDQEAYTPRKIVDINLKAEKPDGQTGIEILGLEAVDQQLVLLSVENNKLFIRSYDHESGQLLGEASIPKFYLPAREDIQKPTDAVTYRENYVANSDPDRKMLTLSFLRGSSEPNRLNRTIISIDFSDGVKVVDTTNTVFDDGEEDSYSGVSYMSYRNGKLYVIKSLREAASESSRLAYDIALPKHLYIYVYEHSKLIYKGVLMSDMNEDNIQAYNMPATQSGFGYSRMDYRYIANVAIE